MNSLIEYEKNYGQYLLMLNLVAKSLSSISIIKRDIENSNPPYSIIKRLK